MSTPPSENVPWYVYVLRCGDGSFYTGIALQVEQRCAQHNAGKGARYTRGRLPVQVVYQEVLPDRGAALRREHEIKQLSRSRKEQLIHSAIPPAPRPATPVDLPH
jgi:predicted GIY-YIG superfamily endonuclease